MVNRNLLRQYDPSGTDLETELASAFTNPEIGTTPHDWLPPEAQTFQLNKIVHGRVLQVVGTQAACQLGIGPRAGDLNAGIVVSRVLGLRNLAELAPAASPVGKPDWYAQRCMDGEGNAWQEIDLARLAHDPAFLQVGA